MKRRSFIAIFINKLGQFVLSIIGASFLIFFIVQLTPGDMAEIHSLSQSTVSRLHLDKPVFLQYLFWLKNCFFLDFGYSLTNGTPVLDLILNYTGATIGLAVGSLFISLSISIPLAVSLGTAPESKFNKMLAALIYSLSSIPVFVVGYILLAIIFRFFKFYPLDPPDGNVSLWAWLTYYILPILVLALGNGTLGEFVRVLSLEIRNVQHSLFIKAARSRGSILFFHFFRPVFIPFLSVVVSRFAVLIGGVVVVERIFNRHGLGWLTWEATLNRDFYVIMSVTLITSVFIRLLMLSSELISISLDPRLRSQ